ncbi:MAG TPA: M66 family metalloprotease, partial [Dermatophilaceae bacterium]
GEVFSPQSDSVLRVDAFSATPGRGATPLVARLGWSIHPAAGAIALRCSVDFEGDGLEDLTVDPCAPDGGVDHTYPMAGTLAPTLTVRDGAGHTAQATTGVEAANALGDAFVSRIDWGQTIVSPTLRLVGLKTALLRVHALGSAPGLRGIQVVASASAGGKVLGSVPLSGPSELPTAIVEEDILQSFAGEVPADWVVPGLSVEVVVDPANAVVETNETNNRVAVDATVGGPSTLPLTLVPVVQQRTTGAVPDAAFLNSIYRVWPVVGLRTTTHAPYTFAGTLSATDGSTWGALLLELDTLRKTDGSTDWYYGLVKPGYSSGIAGLGYVGGKTAVGRDDSDRALIHELGHTFGLSHANCGSPDPKTIDPNFPYAGAHVGTWGWDLVVRKLVDPSVDLDIMSYCNPAWVSDYGYGKAQARLEAALPALVQATFAEALVVRGRILADGTVLFSPVQRLVILDEAPAPGALTLEVVTPAGARQVQADVLEAGEGGERRFFALLPGDLEVLELRLREGSKELGRSRQAGHPEARFAPQLTEGAGRLVVTWDADATPTLSVTHVGRRRSTLALGLLGGRAELPLDGLEDGGTWEVSASAGLNARVHRMGRPQKHP